ncbi:S8 family serine peptidase [Nitratireductor alexandrii]|uniref:S8 family serine peptidase n=1 Tax=Nitratireductor alexandrii TaxID=2448161 RepID=UPI000FD9BA42|nr:S8 family serine peptidase [Nitratireductor alexandrii]
MLQTSPAGLRRHALAFVLAIVVGLVLVFWHSSTATARDGALLVNPRQQATPEPKPKKVETRKAPAAAQPAKTTRKKATTPRSATRKPTRRKTRARVPSETAPSGSPPTGETRFVADEVIVRYRLAAAQPAMDALVRRLNLRHIEGRTFALAGITVHRYAIVGGSPVTTVIAALEADPTVVYAQPNYLYELAQAAAAASGGPQYALTKMAIEAAQAVTTGKDVPVAVIDSAIDVAHPELEAASVETADVTGNAPEPHQHGSTIAALIASRGTLRGIAPDVRMLGIAAFDVDRASGTVNSSSWRVAAAIDHAYEWGARLVNMSFAGPKDPLIARSVAGMGRRGMIAVAAAGNAGPEAPPLYPAAYAGVIAVTATDRDDAVFAKANRGDYVALAAPGVEILGIAPGGRYVVSSGTSLAAAHVSGLAALLLGRAKSLSAKALLDALAASSHDLGDPGVDPVYGAGLPDAGSAISQFGS